MFSDDFMLTAIDGFYLLRLWLGNHLDICSWENRRKWWIFRWPNAKTRLILANLKKSTFWGTKKVSSGNLSQFAIEHGPVESSKIYYQFFTWWIFPVRYVSHYQRDPEGNYGKSPFLMAIFNSYVKLPEGKGSKESAKGCCMVTL